MRRAGQCDKRRISYCGRMTAESSGIAGSSSSCSRVRVIVRGGPLRACTAQCSSGSTTVQPRRPERGRRCPSSCLRRAPSCALRVDVRRAGAGKCPAIRPVGLGARHGHRIKPRRVRAARLGASGRAYLRETPVGTPNHPPIRPPIPLPRRAPPRSAAAAAAGRPSGLT